MIDKVGLAVYLITNSIGECRMHHYQPLTVIRRRDDTGIIAKVEGNKYLIMFEVGANEVEFKWYPASAVAQYGVVG